MLWKIKNLILGRWLLTELKPLIYWSTNDELLNLVDDVVHWCFVISFTLPLFLHSVFLLLSALQGRTQELRIKCAPTPAAPHQCLPQKLPCIACDVLHPLLYFLRAGVLSQTNTWMQCLFSSWHGQLWCIETLAHSSSCFLYREGWIYA